MLGRQRQPDGHDDEAKQQQPVVLITECAKGGISYEYRVLQGLLPPPCAAASLAAGIPDLADLTAMATCFR
ncbi:hypothetical protein C2845_PM13G03520 [Panicum miliaceum]|uniref:Uncharacterized protein n=1 Tax=Panicum miliaceum TaxID=4540 RepID=A0A3L6RKS6_PANMI|nr:hypothetical protein C2845_PM13G03520 [Panicum miliaceum]